MPQPIAAHSTNPAPHKMTRKTDLLTALEMRLALLRNAAEHGHKTVVLEQMKHVQRLCIALFTPSTATALEVASAFAASATQLNSPVRIDGASIHLDGFFDIPTLRNAALFSIGTAEKTV